VDEEDSGDARELAEAEAMEAALRFARRRRLGPFGNGPLDRAQTEKAIAAMIRAGHSFDLAKAILRLEPGSDPFIES
jgi:regulatory protein